MAKLTLNNVGSLIDATTAQATINTNNNAITTAMENTFSLDGTAPNQMGANLDMNSKQVLNLPAPATNNSPLRLQDLTSFIGGGTVSNLPVGGTTGQVLGKNSNTNYDTGWRNSVTSVALSLPTDFAITGSPVTTTGTLGATYANTPTGSGGFVRATSPTLVTPALGTPSAVVLTNATGLPVASVTGMGTGVGTFLATPSSANLLAALTDETGTGKVVFDTSPTINTPAIAGILSVTSNSANSLVVGPNGSVNPIFNVNSANASAVAGLRVTGAATGGTVAVRTTDSGANNNLTIDASGTGTIGIGTISSGAVTVTPPLVTGSTINGVTLNNLAWTSYTPAVTSATGTPTTVSATGRHKQIGKTIHVQMKITITTIGTAAGSVIATLPFTAAAFDYSGIAFESGVTGKSGAAYIQASTNQARILDATAATFWVNGYALVVSATYEVP